MELHIVDGRVWLYADLVMPVAAGRAGFRVVARREPFLRAAMLAPGTHVNAVGAITPERGEFAPDIFARCTVVAPLAWLVPQGRLMRAATSGPLGGCDDGNDKRAG